MSHRQGDSVTVHGQFTFGQNNERYIRVYGIRNSDQEAEKYTAMAEFTQTQPGHHEETENKSSCRRKSLPCNGSSCTRRR